MFKRQDQQYLVLLEVMGRGSETQLQMGDKLNLITYMYLFTGQERGRHMDIIEIYM